jgi:hypothetical protein
MRLAKRTDRSSDFRWERTKSGTLAEGVDFAMTLCPYCNKDHNSDAEALLCRKDFISLWLANIIILR